MLGEHSRPQLKTATYHLPHPSCLVFWVYNGRAFSDVPCVSSGELISGCDPPGDVNHPESQEVLVSNEVCLQFGIRCLSGAAIAPLLALAVSGGGWAGLQPANSAQSFVLCAGLVVS